MQFSKKWLQEFFNESLDKLDLEELLTSAGVEVEDVKDLSSISNQIVVGEIVEIDKHPDADRLNVCHVDVGTKDYLQIVCGAPNARKGIKVPCAMVGAELPEFKIKKAKLRGVESFGMLCSAKELGISDDADGLHELNSGLTLGQPITDALDLNDIIFHLSITPNRADCLSLKGIAREVAALSDLSLKEDEYLQIKASINNTQKIKVEDSTACPRYCGLQISNVDNNIKLPDFIINYLERGGIKSINPVVDITNYVLLERGQPLHAFDQNKLNGEISVRNAKKDEVLILLNEQEIKFHGGELIISDTNGPLALAGIMGGEPSSIKAESKDIFLESAYFNTVQIAGRARSFSLNTESSHRFERGVDFSSTLLSLNYAASLIVKYCGGSISNSIDITDQLPQRKPITLDTKRIVKIMGVAISREEVAAILKKLKFSFTQDKDEFLVTPPEYRFDITIEEDLVEEVIRLFGYNNIPALVPNMPAKMLETKSDIKSIDSIKDTLVSLGYNEVISYSFIPSDREKNLHNNNNLIELENPIASNLSVMRSKMWSSHIEALLYNLNRGQKIVRLFEIASIYKLNNGTFKEDKVLSGLAYGDQIPEQCGEKNRDINFYDIKGDIENISCKTLSFMKAIDDTPACLHPGKTAEILLDKTKVGWLGCLHPSWQQKFELPRDTYLFELNTIVFSDLKDSSYDLPGKFVPVRRDISVLIDKDIVVGDLVKDIYSSKIKNLIKFEPFDIYQGDGIENNKKSIAFLILIQDTYKTLEDKEVSKVVDQVINCLENKFGAKLR